MRLAISNLAWNVDEDERIATLLRQYGVDAIDIAPGKYFPSPQQASADDIARVRGWWTDRGIEITGMQALLFGTTGLNVFGPQESRNAMLHHLTAICRIGAGLNATRIVFGSPKNRDRSGLSDEQAMDIAIPFFRELGEIASSHGVTICLEPNPTRYGANFMTTSEETAMVVERVAQPAIRMQFDTGAIAINAENATAILQKHAPLVGHIHASEPDLLPLGDGSTDHRIAADAISAHLPGHVVSIEMLATANEPHHASIERAIGVAIRHYRNPGRQQSS